MSASRSADTADPKPLLSVLLLRLCSRTSGSQTKILLLGVMFHAYEDYLLEAEGKVQIICFGRDKFFITAEVILFYGRKLRNYQNI